ncbi:hypothetical protein MESS2_980006 [Mesorhizobium metallidurans STM 2683]|uniref:Uncharacterized protein n=1 Tax=Mesorhizobium metallidurans STM 2683 TaxID=1297569 RepID=M5EW99_9HYPH|nr:hypothetical protein MESS2_980006 [Mesorhizobium metallidurans STM 2683]
MPASWRCSPSPQRRSSHEQPNHRSDDPTGPGGLFASPVFPALIVIAVSEIDVLHSRLGNSCGTAAFLICVGVEGSPRPSAISLSEELNSNYHLSVRNPLRDSPITRPSRYSFRFPS